MLTQNRVARYISQVLDMVINDQEPEEYPVNTSQSKAEI